MLLLNPMLITGTKDTKPPHDLAGRPSKSNQPLCKSFCHLFGMWCYIPEIAFVRVLGEHCVIQIQIYCFLWGLLYVGSNRGYTTRHCSLARAF
jgi:hypothetical protein